MYSRCIDVSDVCYGVLLEIEGRSLRFSFSSMSKQLDFCFNYQWETGRGSKVRIVL